MGPSIKRAARSHPPEEFIRFPKLPIELQLSVWSFAIQSSGHRIINIRSRRRSDRLRGKLLPKQCYAVKHTNIISLAHACSHSRALVFHTHEYRFSFANHLERPLLFNPLRDSLFMSDLETLSLFFSASKPAPGIEIAAVRRLAIHTSSVNMQELKKVLARSVGRFGGLAEVTLVTPNMERMVEYRTYLTEDGRGAWLEKCMAGWKTWWLGQPAHVTGPRGAVPRLYFELLQDFRNRTV